MAKRTIVLVALVLLLIHARAQDRTGHGTTFIFGDSLVDAGNNNYMQTLAKANMPPNGIDFKPSGGNPTGRYTNGRTIGDIVGEELGQIGYAVPYLAPNSTGQAIIVNGVNYASGGGGILNATGSLFINRLGFDVQIDYFNVTRKQLDKLLGPSQAKHFVTKKSIFSITIGANDFLNNYLLPVAVGGRPSQTPEAFIGDMINHMRHQLTRLYQLDARKFVIGNVGPLGCTPYQKTLNRLSSNQCVNSANQLALQYNSKLQDLLTELNENLPGATFVYAKVYDLVMDLITNYAKYGFTTSSAACCGNNNQFAGFMPCGPVSTLCRDRAKHVFWDPYHPSEAANIILAKLLVDGDTSHVTPMNVRQLRDL